MLTLQFIPYGEIEDLGPARKVKKLVDVVKDNKIALLEGRLKKEEEADLIAIAMDEIDQKFKGIELAVINPEKKDQPFFKAVRTNFVNFLLGDRQGFTIVGPAAIVKEIKKDPDKIQLFTKDGSSSKRRSKKGK
tara:strand:+ start:71 stop:472 length:402 start_codon:yes stop_codon:yes gene_type:complete